MQANHVQTSGRMTQRISHRRDAGAWRPVRTPWVPVSVPLVHCVRRLILWNGVRAGHGRDTADSRRAGGKRRSRDNGLITLRRSRATGHASAGVGIAVSVRSRETIRQRLQEDDELVLLVIRQAEITDRHVDVVRDLRHGPAVYFFGRSLRAVSGRDIELELRDVACVVEVDELLQALDIAVVEELLLEVRPGRLGGRTL